MAHKYLIETGVWVEEIPYWNGEQPKDGIHAITNHDPMPGCLVHRFVPTPDDPTDGVWEEGATQAEIDAFNAEKTQREIEAQKKLADAEIIKQLPQIIDQLINNGSLTESSLPQAAQDAIARRRALNG